MSTHFDLSTYIHSDLLNSKNVPRQFAVAIANCCGSLDPISRAVNLILKTLHYFHMIVLDEKISKWVHLSFYHKQFSRYLQLKFEKEVIFLGRFSPYEIPESGNKISNF